MRKGWLLAGVCILVTLAASDAAGQTPAVRQDAS